MRKGFTGRFRSWLLAGAVTTVTIFGVPRAAAGQDQAGMAQACQTLRQLADIDCNEWQRLLTYGEQTGNWGPAISYCETKFVRAVGTDAQMRSMMSQVCRSLRAAATEGAPQAAPPPTTGVDPETVAEAAEVLGDVIAGVGSWFSRNREASRRRAELEQIADQRYQNTVGRQFQGDVWRPGDSDLNAPNCAGDPSTMTPSEQQRTIEYCRGIRDDPGGSQGRWQESPGGPPLQSGLEWLADNPMDESIWETAAEESRVLYESGPSLVGRIVEEARKFLAGEAQSGLLSMLFSDDGMKEHASMRLGLLGGMQKLVDQMAEGVAYFQETGDVYFRHGIELEGNTALDNGRLWNVLVNGADNLPPADNRPPMGKCGPNSCPAR